MEEIFKLANIESSVISALIQSIYGSSKVLNQENDEYFIMEVDEKIMKAMTAEKWFYFLNIIHIFFFILANCSKNYI